MKTLYLIGGTMGVGKTTVCREMHKLLPNSVFLDGDWCWDAAPFTVTDETKAMVMDNICHLLNNFIRCSAYENIIFCWVMHQQEIIDEILQNLDTAEINVKCISLTCCENTLKERLEADISANLRTSDVTERSVARLPLYESLNTRKVTTDGKTPFDIAGEIIVS
ncbi:MAG: AAA family ATPase [Oscillospiraceae bacterium]|nr:AAA family ATPase [Oscillospiraceae bacterium]